jgi:DNA-binding transcriptional LysR family regulator
MSYIPLMNGVHLGSVDLNLLVALDALLAERNVTRAAARVGITQSAMSHTLARLRALFDDEILVRGAGGMVATTRAAALGEVVGRALADIAGALAPPRPFDPRTAEGRVTIGTSDYCELVLLPKLFRRLADEAPGLDLRVIAVDGGFAAPLASGRLDLVIAPLRAEEEAPGIRARRLFDERFVCVVRRDHPLAHRRLTLARFAAASHAMIAPRGTEGGPVDDALAKLGYERRVAVAVPHFLVAPYLVASSDVILTLAERVARVVAEPLGLAVLAPPRELALTGFTASAIWHERTQADPALAWVRGVLAEVAETV